MNPRYTWPNGIKHAMYQSSHNKWNSQNYPGTLQLCSKCEQPTDRCEEDEILDNDGNPVCESCFDRVTSGDTP